MRPIGLRPMIVYALFLAVTILMTSISTEFLETKEIKNFFVTFLIFYAFSIFFFRLWLKFFKFSEGPIAKRSKQEFRYQVYASISLFLFNPWTMSSILPVPLATAFYRLLGLKLGKQSYISGIICDPHLVEIGSHSFTGARSILVPHIMEDDYLAHYKIKIGAHVTIGTGATILAGVIIDDFATIGAQALVPKNTKIGRYEIWAGVPARKIGRRSDLCV